jgi:molybdopterin-guanine dinucleotide biosynthesis protein A
LSGASSRGAIVYAGGMEKETISRQFAPDEKGTLLEYVLDSVWTVADELFVVFKHEPDLSVIESISPFGARIVNVSKGERPVTGILTAFKSAKAEHCILVTEAVPLLKPNVVLELFNNVQGNDLSVPRWKDGRIEPLLAVYRGKALLRLFASLKETLESDLGKAMQTLANQLFDVKYLSIEIDLKERDPELDSFLNVKDEISLASARSKASVRGNRLKKSE